jgi:hypothetical protein
MLSLMTLLVVGCSTTRVVVIPSDKKAIRVFRDRPFTSSVDGWFIPDARMIDILNQLDAAHIKSK